MCEYIKTRFPHIYIYTSTNGLAFNEAQARRLVHSGIDEVTFSIDGATQESYVKYRQRGRFDVAIANLRAMADEKRRSGREAPFLNWRYILFIWNDSDEEMDIARRLAADIGVDRLCWEITDHPEDSYSRRFLPGHAGLSVDSSGNLGSDRPGQRDSRRHAAGAHRRPHARAARAAHGTRRPDDARAHARAQPVESRLCGAHGVGPPADTPWRAAVRRRRHAHRSRFRARVAAGQPGAGHVTPTSPSRFPLPPSPGRYALKFDLVCEGIDWFERCGSETTIKPLVVR